MRRYEKNQKRDNILVSILMVVALCSVLALSEGYAQSFLNSSVIELTASTSVTP